MWDLLFPVFSQLFRALGFVVVAGDGQVRQWLLGACGEAVGLWLGRAGCGDVEGSLQAGSDGEDQEGS